MLSARDVRIDPFVSVFGLLRSSSGRDGLSLERQEALEIIRVSQSSVDRLSSIQIGYRLRCVGVCRASLQLLLC